MKGSSSQHYFLVALMIGAIILAFLIIKPFFAPLALGAVFAVVLQPVYRWVMRKTKSGESVSALLTVMLCLIVLLVPVFIAAVQLLKEAQALYGSYGTNTQFIFTQWIDAHGPVLDHYVFNGSGTLRNLTLSLDDY